MCVMNKHPSNSTDRLDERLQQRLEAVLDGMPVAVSWAGHKDQEIRYVNKKFTEMFGYQLGDHNTVMDWIQQVYPRSEQVERALTMWAPHFDTTAIAPFEIDQVEVDVLCKDGSVKTTLLSGVILPNEGWALAIFTDITARKQEEIRNQKLAMEDPLTGLGNRRAFDEALMRNVASARRHATTLALLLVDLDHLKELNDTLGHVYGDMALQTIAARLRSAVRTEDFVCRLGGDEFGVIMDNISGPDVVEHVTKRILREACQPYSADDKPVSLSVSIGLALFPGDADDEESLYESADEALYRAKQSGRGRWSR